MVDRPIKAAIESRAQHTVREVRSLCPWLPDPHICDCGAWCDPEVRWVPRQAMRMPVWQCSDCDRRYHRTRD